MVDQPPAQPVFTIGGDRLQLLDTGPRRLSALLDLIGGAQSSLRILYYIYADDNSGRAVRDALLAACERGVAVDLIVDGFGSDVDPEFFAPLSDAGATVCRFLPRLGRRYLLRNHQKLALADDARVIIGGFNVEDDYFGTPAQQAWRDLGLLVEGRAAARLAPYFDGLSRWSRNPKGRIRDLRQLLKAHSEKDGRVRWLLGGPTRRLSPWAQTLRADLRQASQIDMIAAYFTPSPTMLRRIDRVAPRGRVRIVTAAKSDNDTTIAAARFTYAGLLRRGVEVYEYQPTKLHTKLYVIDNTTQIGSGNFDVRSLFLNLEMMLRIDDVDFAAHLRRYVDGEIAQSQRITREAHARTGVLRRMKRFVAYFIVAVVDFTVTRRLNFRGEG